MRVGCLEAVGVVPTRDVEAAVEDASSPAVSTRRVHLPALVRHTFKMADDRLIDGVDVAEVDDGLDELDRDTITLLRTRRTARGTGPVPPREDVAQRYAIAAERRRLLSHALHSDAANDDAELESEHAVTHRYTKLSPAEAPLAEGSTIRPHLHDAVERLRVQAAECRAQAIALNAKLVLLEADRAQMRGPAQELHAVREQLIESSARLDHAVDEIEAVTSVEEQLSTLR